MKKKILVFCLLVFILLLSIPSISAKQQNISKIDLRKQMNLSDDVKFPNLYKFISLWIFNRFYRSVILLMVSSSYNQETGEIIILKPIIYKKAVWLLYSSYELNEFFQNLSDKYGWNWQMPI